jgi:nucleoside-diphosphate-sugar epimerase
MEGEQTILVTGGSGFLGGWCLVELLKRGHRARATVRDLARESEVRAGVGSQVDPGTRLTVHAADLTSEAGWAEAIEGCDYVLHVASPFPPAQPKDADELIVPAREGTLRVLRKSLEAGVKRIVVTSSVAAVRNAPASTSRGGRELTESDWSDPDDTRLTPYTRSKAIAELAAWDYMRSQGAEERLVTVQPGAIIGPVLGADRSYSLQAVERMLTGRMPGIPHLGFSFIDVRDVAALQVGAMTAPDAAGQRLIAADTFLWLSEVAEILRSQLGADARKVPRRRVPDFVIRMMARFDPEIRSVVGDLGQRTTYSTENARARVAWAPRPIEETIVECARSLLAHTRPAAASAA